MENLRLYLIILLVGAVFSGITLLIAKFERNKWFIKYIPAVILFLIVVGFIIMSRRPSTGFQDLAYIILAIIAFGGGVISLLTSIAVDIYKMQKAKIDKKY